MFTLDAILDSRAFPSSSEFSIIIDDSSYIIEIFNIDAYTISSYYQRKEEHKKVQNTALLMLTDRHELNQRGK